MFDLKIHRLRNINFVQIHPVDVKIFHRIIKTFDLLVALHEQARNHWRHPLGIMNICTKFPPEGVLFHLCWVIITWEWKLEMNNSSLWVHKPLKHHQEPLGGPGLGAAVSANILTVKYIFKSCRSSVKAHIRALAQSTWLNTCCV